MPPPVQPPRQGPLRGTAAVFLAESVALPVGFVVAGVLTRALGPGGYGRYSVAATLITTLEWILVALLARPTIKFVAEASDWRPVAATAFRAYTSAGIAMGAALWLLARPIGVVLDDATLVDYLRLFALELPIFAAATACRNALTGLARYQQHALASAGRWVGRLLFILLFVQLGWSVWGAILGNIGGAVVAWAVAQAYVGRAVWGRAEFPGRDLFQLAVPAFLLALSARLFDRFGLLALKALGGTAAEAGYYGAAQNLLMIAGIVSMSVTPILISTVTAGRRTGNEPYAQRVALTSLRLAIWVFPFTAIVAGASPEIVQLLFGAAFAPAARLVAVLIGGAGGLILISVASALLIAIGRPWPAVVLTAPLLPLSVIAHIVVIPRLGGLGAALVTVSTALVVAAVCIAIVCVVWPLRMPLATLVKATMVSCLAYVAAAAWAATGLLLVAKCAVLSAGVVVIAGLLGEFTLKDLEWIWPIGGRRAPPDVAGRAGRRPGGP